MLAYTLETILAEKYETIIRRNISTTRARDFYYLYVLYKTHNDKIDIPVLKLAVDHTASKRGSKELMIEWKDIIVDIRTENELNNYWKNYTENHKYAAGLSFDEVVDTVYEISKLLSAE